VARFAQSCALEPSLAPLAVARGPDSMRSLMADWLMHVIV